MGKVFVQAASREGRNSKVLPGTGSNSLQLQGRGRALHPISHVRWRNKDRKLGSGQLRARKKSAWLRKEGGRARRTSFLLATENKWVSSKCPFHENGTPETEPDILGSVNSTEGRMEVGNPSRLHWKPCQGGQGRHRHKKSREEEVRRQTQWTP